MIVFIHENAIENIVRKMSAILFSPQYAYVRWATLWDSEIAVNTDIHLVCYFIGPHTESSDTQWKWEPHTGVNNNILSPPLASHV